MSAADWTQILVGDQDPKGLSVISTACSNRRISGTAHHHFSDLLQKQQSTSLLNQEGITAEDIKSSFTQGADLHRQIGNTNDTIAAAYQAAHDSGTELQRELSDIARDGNYRINQIQSSGDPLPMKVGKITEVVMDCKTQANVRAATHCGNTFDQIQKVLDKRGIPLSARQFAQSHGTDITRSFGSPNPESVRQQVEKALNPTGGGKVEALGNLKQGGGPGPSSGNPSAKLNFDDAHIPANNVPVSSAQNPVRDVSLNNPQVPANDGFVPSAQNPVRDIKFTNSQVPLNAGPTGPGGTVPVSPSLSSPGLSPTVSSPGMPFSPSSAPPIAASSPPPFAPTTLTQSFDHGFDRGLQMGNPMGATTNAMPPAGPVAPQVPPPTAPLAQAAPTIPATTQTPVFDTAHAADFAAPPPPHIASDPGPAYLAAPASAAAPQTPVGPLPAYGADIRPAVVTPPAPPAPPTAPSGPLSAAPSSGPVNPSAGVGQPAVVRQSSTQAAQPLTPAGVAEQSVVAAAGGSGAGAASAAATARARLQRLVDAVARQAPRLSWAAGDRPDGTTVLVTDLASGWIPPDIGIPTGVELLEPAQRRSNLEALLGEVTAAASYTPIHYLPPLEEKELAPTSSRARQGPVVDELGWELGQATNWRDGLPRLAHTIAKAASTGTGVVDNELELLHDELGKVRNEVLDGYPDNVDAAIVGNWQLLAAIDALAGGDNIGANYHLAWFKALNQATTAGAI